VEVRKDQNLLKCEKAFHGSCSFIRELLGRLPMHSLLLLDDL